MTAVVTARDLAIDYLDRRTDRSQDAVRALDGASFALDPGLSLGLVGESGSGKTTLGMAVGRLLPANARRVEGELRVAGRSVFELDDEAIRALRRDTLGFVFQSPMAALDPTMRIGRQVALSAGAGAVPELLRRVGLPDPEGVARAYPHELSGGMAQRVVIAIAIARGPRLLIADEPTAALDTSIRTQILALLMALKDETGAAVVLLSHELSVVARHCDLIGVMYGGRIVEFGDRAAVFRRPLHPYTAALLEAAPERGRPGERLTPIPGVPPVLKGRAGACAFAPRCALARDLCRRERPPLRSLDERRVACHRAEEMRARPGDARGPG